MQPDNATTEVSTNEDKAATFHRCFFPPKPSTSSLPASPEYPPQINYKFRLLEVQLRHQISRLRPFKVPGEDGIQNVVLKEVVDLVIPYLVQIFQAVFKRDTYSDHWHTWNTVVLCKPGKARYNVPKAYQPITLIHTISKLLSAIVVEDMSHMCEKHCLLPDTHFGSRPGKNTLDSMQYLVNRVKGAWRQHKVATVLFLDIKGAFPNAVTDHLLHNLQTRWLPEPYVCFIEWMLTNQHTRLRFDRFTSDWVNIDNGIVQGDPLSMLLYLFYNTDLIMVPKKEEAMIAYVDDASYYAEGVNFKEVYGRLHDMMERAQGSFVWSDCHNSHFEPSKMVRMGLHTHTPDLCHPGKLAPEPHPDLHLCGAIIKPSPGG